MDWNRDDIYEIRRGDDGTIESINPFLQSWSYRRPQEMVQGADGTLYPAEWGDQAFFGPNPDSGIYRIEYRPSD